MTTEGVIERGFVTTWAPGCSPSAEQLRYGIIQLQNKIKRTNAIAG